MAHAHSMLGSEGYRHTLRICNTYCFSTASMVLWDNVEECSRDREDRYVYIKWRMRIACCVAKATDTHSEYVILIAFPRHQWLRENASMLRLRTLLVFLVDRRQPEENTEERHRLYPQADMVCSFPNYWF